MLGVIINTAAAEKNRPPATAKESELCGFSPSGSKAKGKRGAIEVAVVIKTVDILFPPLSCKTIALFTEVPNKRVNAIIEFMFSEEPKAKRVRAAPKKLGGTADK